MHEQNQCLLVCRQAHVRLFAWHVRIKRLHILYIIWIPKVNLPLALKLENLTKARDCVIVWYFKVSVSGQTVANSVGNERWPSVMFQSKSMTGLQGHLLRGISCIFRERRIRFFCVHLSGSCLWVLWTEKQWGSYTVYNTVHSEKKKNNTTLDEIHLRLFLHMKCKIKRWWKWNGCNSDFFWCPSLLLSPYKILWTEIFTLWKFNFYNSICHTPCMVLKVLPLECLCFDRAPYLMKC